MEITPFLMDEEKERFIVFRAERENAPDAYVWVGIRDRFNPNRDIRITDFTSLCAYCTQTVGPFYAGEMPKETVELAMTRFESCPEDVLEEKIIRYNAIMSEKTPTEEDEKEFDEWENKELEDAMEVIKNGGGEVWF